MTTIGATTGDTVLSPYQVGTDPDGENNAWVAEVEARGYVPCSDICGCVGTTFGIVYHTPEYLQEVAKTMFTPLNTPSGWCGSPPPRSQLWAGRRRTRSRRGRSRQLW